MESFLAELVLAQQGSGMEVAAVVHGQPRPEDPEWLVRVPVQWRLVYTPIALGFRRAIASAIERFKPDILHLHMPNVAVFWLLTLPQAQRIAWVVHWHSDVIVSSRSPLPLRLAYMAYRPFEQAILERCDRIVATSETYLEVSEPLTHWRYKCAAIPLGISTSLPQPPRQDPQPERVFEWPDGLLRLLSIGRLAHYKGFETLVRAVAATEGVQMVIAGDGEARTRLLEMVKAVTAPGQTPRIHLLGEVSEAHKHHLLASCDAFCLASRERTEAFGVVLLEAMAHAKPCLVADLPGSGMPWVVRTAGAGISGIPVDDPHSWAQALAHVRDNRERLEIWGQQGRRGLETYFSIEACAQAISGQYATSPMVSRISREYRIAQPDPAPAEQRTDVLIVIPARNEQATIAQVVGQARKAGWQHVLVIDDHSQDDTAGLARQAGAQVIRPALPTGAWGAMQLGIRHGLTRGFLAVITMDADGQHEVDELPKLLGRAHQADVLIGAFPQRVSWMRKLAWAWFALITRLQAHDLTSGFRYYNRRAMQALGAPQATLLDYQDVGVLLLLQKAGLRMVEVPVSMNARASGHSRIFSSWWQVIRYLSATTLISLSRRPWRRRKS
jgi:glycosyltransferase involved in cell wall biosynthesis